MPHQTNEELYVTISCCIVKYIQYPGVFMFTKVFYSVNSV